MRLPRLEKSNPSDWYSISFQPLPISEAHPPARKDVQRGGLLGNQDGLALRQDQHTGGKLDPRRDRRHKAKEDKRFVESGMESGPAGVAARAVGIGSDHVVVRANMRHSEPFRRAGVGFNSFWVISKLKMGENSTNSHGSIP